MGGMWIGASGLCYFIVSLFHKDRLYKKLVYKYYRRPEVFQYAYAEQIQKTFAHDKYSEKEFANLQIEENQKAAYRRSQNELDGKIKLPPQYMIWFENFKRFAGYDCNMMT